VASRPISFGASSLAATSAKARVVPNVIAALTAVVAPELLMTQGHLIDSWRDARIFGALAGLAFYAWRGSLFGTIVSGTGAMMQLRFAMGW
jgi:branched-subunit amino acid transport protein